MSKAKKDQRAKAKATKVAAGQCTCACLPSGTFHRDPDCPIHR